MGREEPFGWPPHSPTIVPFYIFLWSFVKGKLYNQRVNMLNDSKHESHAAILYLTKNMLQLVWQNVDYM